MHDLDRVNVQRNRRGSVEDPRAISYEGELGAEREVSSETGGAPLAESEVTAAAAKLLETSEQEFGAFVRQVVRRVGQIFQQAVVPAAADALTRALRPVADRTVPAMGDDPSAEPATGGELGLELEGLSQEDREFETAKQFVRLASTAAAIAASAPPHVPPEEVARTAVVEAAKEFAPGFVGRLERGPGPTRAQISPPGSGVATRGRWYRRGNQLILVGI